jgi:hypothetical protein
MALAVATITVTTTPRTIVQNDTATLVNVAGPASVILPTGGAADDGRSYYIKDKSGNAAKNPITITAGGGRLIDGQPFAILNNGYSHVQVVSDGANWFTIS